MELKFESFDASHKVKEWLKEHPHVKVVSQSSTCCINQYTEFRHFIDIFYTEPEPESYRKPGQPG